MHSLAALSRGLVQLFRHRVGRGPTQAKSFWAGEDALLVLFGGGYTKAEQSAHHDPDVMAAVFLLEPLGGSGSAEAGRWDAGDEPASHSPLRPRQASA